MAYYSGRIHDPNHTKEEYDIYFNDELVSGGYDSYSQVIGLINRTGIEFEIPEGVADIGVSAFRGMDKLTKLIIPDSVTSIKTYGIASTSMLSEIYLPASITQIASNAFTASKDGIIIKCGFAQDAVAGAPWGATNAVITYNQERPEGL